MLDLKMYHDNLGLYLRTRDADYSLWLLNGMDSNLQVISNKFTSHRKLTRPFEEDYRGSLKKPISDIREALEGNDFPSAVKAYKILTRNCNGCHIDHDIDKEVLDNTLPQR
jgi:hypothetical protein